MIKKLSQNEVDAQHSGSCLYIDVEDHFLIKSGSSVASKKRRESYNVLIVNANYYSLDLTTNPVLQLPLRTKYPLLVEFLQCHRKR